MTNRFVNKFLSIRYNQGRLLLLLALSPIHRLRLEMVLILASARDGWCGPSGRVLKVSYALDSV